MPTLANLKIGLVDTTFSRVNMGAIAIDELSKNYPTVEYVRKTVPGIKDLAVECQILLTTRGCDTVIAMGMVGEAPIDTQCAHEASIGIQWAKLNTNRHIVEVFVHMNEAKSEQDLFALAEDRVRKHVHNAVWLACDPQRLVERAGSGRRQGRQDAGPITPGEKKTRKR
jgi:riboflavin synthase